MPLMSEKTLKNIVNAPLFNRTFGAIIDLVLTIFVGAGIFLGISNIAYNVSWIKAYKEDFNQVMVDSGLMQLNKGNLEVFEYDDYLSYQTMFYDFYHDYYKELTDKEYDIYWYNVHIYGLDDTLARFDNDDLNNRSSLAKNIGHTLFTYKLDSDSQPLVNEFALPIASNNGNKELNEDEKQQLVDYFYVSDDKVNENEIASKYRYVYYYALSDLTSLSRLQNDYNKYALFGTTLPLVITIFISFMIFYFIVPLCFKNGETIGKLIMHTCLLNKLGYQYSKLQLIPRFLFPTFLTIAIVFIMGFSIWAFVIVSVAILASFLFVVFSKDNKALHDYFAGTLVIDKRASTWFKSIQEEEAAEADVEAFVENVKNNDDPNNRDNVIYTNPHFKDKK